MSCSEAKSRLWTGSIIQRTTKISLTHSSILYNSCSAFQIRCWSNMASSWSAREAIASDAVATRAEHSHDELLRALLETLWRTAHRYGETRNQGIHERKGETNSLLIFFIFIFCLGWCWTSEECWSDCVARHESCRGEVSSVGTKALSRCKVDERLFRRAETTTALRSRNQ